MEEGDPFTPKSPVGNLSSDAANAMDLDFIDELFLDGCWIETTDSFDFDLLLQPGTSLSPAAPIDSIGREEIEGKLKGPADNGDGNGSNDPQAQGTEGGKRLWIPPNLSTSPGSSSLPSVKERLMMAVGYLQECTKGSDVLIQIWIPVKRGGKNVLTTDDQPFTLDPYSKPLESYRNVSRKYQFPADEDSKESVGLPGRVFLAKVPEWTPDVRFFRSEEYPRIDYARQCDVRGSVAVPVFERGSGTCLGVVELVTTSQKINYRPDLEIVCKALEAVDLRSSQSFSPPGVKGRNELYQSALPRILEVLKSVSKIYGLPLALTWASCVLQGKEGCRHSDENYSLCVSTVDPACFVADAGMHGFLEACSEHHLLRGQGVVGKAFAASKPCFSTDITAFGKTEYPLSHHARMFELHCAIAIPLVSIYTDSTDFVLELFLPKDCKEPENRDQVLNSLAGVIHQAFHNSQFVTTKEIGVSLDEILQKEETKVPSSPMREQDREHPSKESSWITNMVENQRKGKGVSVSVEYPKQPREEFRLTTHWDAAAPQSLYQGFWQVQENSEPKSNGEGGNVSNSFGGTNSSGSKKTRERKRTKAEKTISLEVLRQYFAGSLKDAARSIGVCPTTLKRICRQHGINRWPSRKIKKVGHSLKKLQGVMDSVQGAEGSIQLESFYASFPELSPGVPGSNGPAASARTPQNDPQKKTSKSNLGPEENGFVSSSQSPSSSCSQSSTSIANASSSGGTAMEDMGEVIKRAHSEAELMKSTQENISPKPNPLLRSQSHKLFGKTIAPIDTLPPKVGGLKVKASYGEEKIRFSLQTSWGFRELQQEIAKRFGIDDFVGKIDLKYLDDDSEWVLLTCDADLEECIDVCRASSANRIQISLHHQASKLNLNSYGSSGAQSQHHERFL